MYAVGRKRCGAVSLALEGKAPPVIARQVQLAAERAGPDVEAVEREDVRFV